ncbi:hypothetical protein SCLCIDRAFT_131762 [Scleroderma citrinum Foug A]|uniref:Small ribosomal subunit protein mS41 n=1 Tax=Scleroderma citrinum Foug A TaxID=1036808 RepID=A0A0C3DKF9_9AGAM|nr:hypothetical protein SCLCIDRAFT_131762 [Scleroderma citrinum Foug A]
MFSLRHLSESVVRHCTRSVHNAPAIRSLPDPRGKIATPDDFLKAIGRGSEKKVSMDSWEAFWRTNGWELKGANVAVKDRRYILWCMEKYRQGVPIEQFAHESKPKKKIRGYVTTFACFALAHHDCRWGPAVQHGKRIR